MGIPKYYCFSVFTFFALYSFSIHADAQTSPKKLDSFNRAINLSKTDTGKITRLLAIADAISCYDTLNKISYINQALQLSEKIKWDKGICYAKISLADVYARCSGNHLLAIRYFGEANEIAKASHQKSGEISALNGLAMAYMNLAQYANALSYFKQLIAAGAEIPQRMGTLGNMGIVYTSVGDYPDALTCYDSSLRLLDEEIRTSKKSNLDDTLQMAGLLITIGDIYIAMSQYDKALENDKNALALAKQLKNKMVESMASVGLGKTYHYKNDYLKAIEYFNKALEDSKENGWTNSEAGILIELGNVYLEKGEIDTALQFARKSLDLSEKHRYFDLLPASLTILGKIYTAQKKYTEAVSCLQKAVAICGKNCTLDGEKDAWEALSNTYDRMKQPALAFDAYKHFISLRDSVYSISKANELTRIDLQTGYTRDSVKHAEAYRYRIQKQRVFIYSGFTGFVLVLLLAFFIYRNYALQKKANITISRAHEAVKQEKQVSENLLLNILPEDVAKELKTQGNVEARLFDHVTVLFTDFVNFTEAAENDAPKKLVAELHSCFMAFDSIISKYNVEKIKTIGDAYLAVSGLPHANPQHASEIIKVAIEFRDYMIARKKEIGDNTFSMRIGVNSGTVVAGIVGVKKFAYDIWGDSVNTAARMQQYSSPDRINISQTTYELVKDEFTFTDRGEIEVKSKGMMRMYFVEK